MTEQEKSYSQMRREFYEKFSSKIVPLVQRHESSRKTRLFIAITILSCLFLLASLLIYTAFSSGEMNQGAFKLAVLFYALSYLSWFWIKKSFENSIKERIMPTICKCFGDMKWSEGSYGHGEVFFASRVVPKFTSSEYDDIFEGSYKDVSLEIVESEYIYGSGKHRRTVFNGVIVKLDMNKPFTSHTVIKPNTLMHLSPSPDLKHTELEDVEFNRKYDVFTNDEVDARYLITPSFMERLKNMKTAFEADGISCAFFGNLLIVAMSTRKDLFSICSLVKPIDDRKQFVQMYEEIVSIIKLIDHFKLNQKIGL